jgi:hypothetical protein
MTKKLKNCRKKEKYTNEKSKSEMGYEDWKSEKIKYGKTKIQRMYSKHTSTLMS